MDIMNLWGLGVVSLVSLSSKGGCLGCFSWLSEAVHGVSPDSHVLLGLTKNNTITYSSTLDVGQKVRRPTVGACLLESQFWRSKDADFS